MKPVPVAVALLLAACGPEKRVVYFHGTDAPYIASEWSGAALMGEYRRYHETTRELGVRGIYRDGVRHGVWNYRYETAKEERREEYQNGIRHGLWTEWYPSGAKRNEGSWVEGDRDGQWAYYREDGSIEALETWERGTRVAIERL